MWKNDPMDNSRAEADAERRDGAQAVEGNPGGVHRSLPAAPTPKARSLFPFPLPGTGLTKRSLQRPQKPGRSLFSSGGRKAPRKPRSGSWPLGLFAFKIVGVSFNGGGSS